MKRGTDLKKINTNICLCYKLFNDLTIDTFYRDFEPIGLICLLQFTHKPNNDVHLLLLFYCNINIAWLIKNAFIGLNLSNLLSERYFVSILLLFSTSKGPITLRNME